jgi:hypothetical protein
MSALTNMMARAVHPGFDEEDEATAYAMVPAIAAYLRSSRAEEVAMQAVSAAMVSGNMPMSYGDTVRCVLAAIASEVSDD